MGQAAVLQAEAQPATTQPAVQSAAQQEAWGSHAQTAAAQPGQPAGQPAGLGQQAGQPVPPSHTAAPQLQQSPDQSPQAQQPLAHQSGPPQPSVPQFAPQPPPLSTAQAPSQPAQDVPDTAGARSPPQQAAYADPQSLMLPGQHATAMEVAVFPAPELENAPGPPEPGGRNS